MSDKSKPKAKGVDLQGLDDFSVSSFISGGKKEQAPKGADSQTEAGGINYAPMDNFHEDEDNARLEFDSGRLNELAESMKRVNPKTGQPRGILEPLSVKHHPDMNGHFVINGGARRYRAAKLAGLEKAPYIIKDELDDFDKFVLNDQREQLSPMEIAVFISGRLKEGHKPGEVAKALGRRPAYVSDHSVFFDLPGCVRDLYDNGRCRSMQVLAWLHRAYKKHPEEVEEFCSKGDEEISSTQVRAFLDSFKKQEAPKTETVEDSEDFSSTGDNELDQSEPEQDKDFPDEEQHQLPIDDEPTDGNHLEDKASQILEEDEKEERIKKAIIQVKHDEREARLLTDRRASYGLAWIKYDDDGHEVEADLNQVALVAVIEA